MYAKWCEKKNWSFDIIDEQGEPTVRKCTVRIVGDGASQFFKNEQGVHKLTRVSPYGNGKKHTSCVALSVFQELKLHEVSLPEKDLRWDTFRGTGAGGQHRNKRDTAVRLTHLPTFTVVTVLSGRSQHQNKQDALAMLKAKMQEVQDNNHRGSQKEHVNRQAQGFGHQVRTYKLDQQMVRDEKTGKSHSQPQKVLDGDLDWVC